ncbi:MAG TPA: hypothetical protein VIU93_09050 [Gallionellaceae bacterium]
MSELRLDYQRSVQAFPVEGLLLFALALLLLLASGMYYRSLNTQADVLEARAGKNEHLAQRGPSSDRAAAALALEVKRANEVLRQLTTPWGGLFQTLETSAGRNVALLTLEPDTEKRLVKISGEAKDMMAMLNYVQRLENRDAFGTVYLQSHHVQLQDPDKPVRFVVQATWVEKS